MGFRINTNIAAMDAHRNSLMTNQALDKSLKSLSSGLRINTAADDASGMTIADSLRSQAQGLGQAIRNANDGVAVVQTADGALNEYVKIINSVRTKSIQAASDGQNADSRGAIQKDITRLLQEANNIAKTTQFNGQKLLDGTFTNKSFQIGAYAGETVNLSVGNVQTNSVGDIKGFTGQNTREGSSIIDTNTAESATGRTLKSGLLTVNGTDLSASINKLSPLKTTDAAALASAITDATGLVANGTNTLVSGAAIAGGDINSTNQLLINGVAIADTTVQANDSDSALRNAINNISDQTGVTATVDAKGKLNLVSNDGSNISVTTTSKQSAIQQIDSLTINGTVATGNTILATVGTQTVTATVTASDSFKTSMEKLATALTTTSGIASSTYTAASQSNTISTSAALTAADSITISGLATSVGAIAVTALTGDTAAQAASEVVTALNADSNFAALYKASFTSGDVTISNITGTDTFGTAATFTVAGTNSTVGSATTTAESFTATGATDGRTNAITFDTSNATGITKASTTITTDGQAAITTAQASSTVTGLTLDHLTNQNSTAVSFLDSATVANKTILKGELIINGTDLAGTYGDNTTAGSAGKDLQAAIKAISGMENSSIDSQGVIKLVVNNGNDLNIAGTKAVNTYNLDNGIFNESKAGKVNIFSNNTIKVGGTDSKSFGLTGGTYAPTSTKSSLDSIDVTSRNAAEVSILVADSALKQIDATRSDLGSVQNQLQSTVRNISVTQVNVTSAESQIRDVDFAKESANFAKLNILAQSGSYAMSQANAIQKNVMRLLQ